MENTFNPQQIICVKDAYDTEKEFWEAIGMQLKLLTDQGYYVLFRHDDCDVYIIEFKHDPQSANEDWGCNRFAYLTASEEEEVLNQRKVAASNE